MSPLENAIETMEKTNQRIKLLVDEHCSNPSFLSKEMGMVLNGVIDAAVSGGISNYKVMLKQVKNSPHQTPTYTTESNLQSVI